MHLVELFLPLADNEGIPFKPDKFTQLRDELTRRFGGVTSFSRAPAKGTYEDGGRTFHDDIAILEVMTGELDRAWWADLRKRLEDAIRSG